MPAAGHVTCGARWRQSRRDGAVRGRVRSVDLVTSLRQAGVDRGDLVGLVISPAVGLGVATAERAWPAAPGLAGDVGAGLVAAPGAGLAAEVGRADDALRPRWAVWSGQT